MGDCDELFLSDGSSANYITEFSFGDGFGVPDGDAFSFSYGFYFCDGSSYGCCVRIVPRNPNGKGFDYTIALGIHIGSPGT